MRHSPQQRRPAEYRLGRRKVRIPFLAFEEMRRFPLTASATISSTARIVLFQTHDDNAVTSVPKRKSKRKGRRKRTRQKANTGPISEQDLRHHVANQYMHGPGGKLKATAARSARNSFLTNGHAAHLKKLDRYPALLLNADYQVRVTEAKKLV